MSLQVVREWLVAALEGVPGLVVYDHAPRAVGEFPAVTVRLARASYTDATYTWRLQLVGSAWRASDARDVLEPYLEPAGASSIAGALTALDFVAVTRAGDVRRLDIGGAGYWGVELTAVAQEWSV